MGTGDCTVFIIKELKGYAILWKSPHILTIFNVSATQNITCTEAWLTIYLTASGPTRAKQFLVVKPEGKAKVDINEKKIPDKL